MPRLLIDTSSLLWQSLLASKDKEYGYEVEFEGKPTHVNGWQFGLECATSHLVLVMRELNITPADVVLVVEGEMSKARRKAIYNGYKDGRGGRPPEAYVEFNRCKDEIVGLFGNLGATTCVQRGCEADDVIAWLVAKIEGEKVILSRDGDMTALISPTTALWQNGMLTRANKYGPFSPRYTAVFKALCGDSSDNIKGAPGFGPKAYLDLLVWAGEPGLAALEGMIQRRTLPDLAEDIAEFKPLRKIVEGAESVYVSYEVACMHPEWVNTERNPLIVTPGRIVSEDQIKDDRLRKFALSSGAATKDAPCDLATTVNPPKVKVAKQHAVFDIEIIGLAAPVFLVCAKIVETGETFSFWHHVEGDMDRLHAMLKRPDLTWVSFNGIRFDAPLISAAICGKDVHGLKRMATTIVNDESMGYWQLPKVFNYDPIEFDHIDLFETAPGVHISLKTFAGRLGYKTMVDMPFHHDTDLTPEQLPIVEKYCLNDVGVTEALFNTLRTEITLREEMGEEHGLDLRSKSDAQVAEAILCKVAGIPKGKKIEIPSFVRYKAPDFIKTDSPIILDLIAKSEACVFKMNHANGRVESPDFLIDPIKLGWGSYQFGIGGIHSTSDKRLHLEADDMMEISDLDVAGYYPRTIMIAGLIPRVEGGDRFMKAYSDMYDKRIEAKRAGNKKVANALKIALNGSYGKLSNMYCPFYSPDLMLAVTMTGQFNLACLIHELEKIERVHVLSANTDGIMVHYPKAVRQQMLDAVRENAMRTGYDYEETPYAKIALKDVNNYICITQERNAAIVYHDGSIVEEVAKGGKAKQKGLYASIHQKVNPLFLNKNPTMNTCSELACDYLKYGTMPRDGIKNYTDPKDYVEIRNVKGGAVQYDGFEEVDDWVCVKDVGTKDNEWARQAWLDKVSSDQAGVRVVKRKSRPAPVKVGNGGCNVGRVVRWYMSTTSSSPICYATSGNKVPGTDGARLCMTLPDTLPDDIDYEWYITEAERILSDVGVLL